ncbi:MAG: carboxylate-amine ligase [Hyphomicrobiales bacterium]|nr:MAG: carboxylate-amine ligase [Hyphomicrobiales bacterium]
MNIPAPALTLGIEEEYLLVDVQTRDLVQSPPEDFMSACVETCGEQVANEFMKSQIEIGTKVCRTIGEAREDLTRLRRAVIEAARGFGLAPIAASTHPFARWTQQQHTEKERYETLAHDLGGAVERLLICGMHVHIGIEDHDLRIDLMNQVAYFLPHMLALTTSSPYWQGRDTGLNSYRLTVFDALPRTGLPDIFDSFGEYRRMIDQLIKVGALEDATKLWWDIRPSDRFPTIEARVMDVCTDVEDTLTVAALYQSIMSMLFRLRQKNQRWRLYPKSLMKENRWRAQRYGPRRGLIDFGRAEMVPVAELMEELISIVSEDAEALGCLGEVKRSREIVNRGTSAEAQREVYQSATENGADHKEALREVVDFLIERTASGL